MKTFDRIRHIFRECYNLLETYQHGISSTDWQSIADYPAGRLDEADPLAVAMYVACVDDLERQYLKEKKE